MNDADLAEIEWARSLVFDASAAVKLVVSEPGSASVHRVAEQEELCYLSSISLAEAFGVLKRKWQRKQLDTDSYYRAVALLAAYTREGGLLILDDEAISDFQVVDKAEALARNHQLDIADALQIYSLKFGCHSIGDGESRPILVTGDRGLAQAARAEHLLVWYCVDEPCPPPRQP